MSDARTTGTKEREAKARNETEGGGESSGIDQQTHHGWTGGEGTERAECWPGVEAEANK